MTLWNLIHGCHRKSEGCLNCYVFARDGQHGVDTNIVRKTAMFNLPLRKDRKGDWKIPPGSLVMTCFSSDFFIEEMDQWRDEAWDMIRERRDLKFYIVTKRPERISRSLPDYWQEIEERVYLCCTMENQQRVDERLPIFSRLRHKHKDIIVEPILGPIDFHGGLSGIGSVTVGGESGMHARQCNYEWILDIRRQCADAGIGFWFKQTGGRFVKDGKTYRLAHRVQMQQAGKAGIDLVGQRESQK